MIRNKMLLRIIYTFLFFIISWGANLPGPSIAGITLFPLRITILLWIIISLLLSNLHFTLDRRLMIGVSLFLTCGLLCSLWSQIIDTSISAFLVYLTSILTMLMISSLIDSHEKMHYFCEAVLINVLIMAAVAINESLTGVYHSVSYDYYAWTFNIFGTYKPLAAFYNTNNLASYFVMCLPFEMIALENKGIIFKTVAIGFCGFLALICDCRTALLSVLVFTGLFLFYELRDHLNKLWSSVILFFVSVLSVGIVLLSNLSLRTLFLNKGSLFSGQSRFAFWVNTFDASLNHFLIGTGLGTSGLYNGYGAPHNMILELLCEVGIIGLFAFCLIIFSLWPNKREVKESFSSRCLHLFFLIFLLSSVCVSTMQGFYFMWAFFGLAYANKIFLRLDGNDACNSGELK